MLILDKANYAKHFAVNTAQHETSHNCLIHCVGCDLVRCCWKERNKTKTCNLRQATLNFSIKYRQLSGKHHMCVWLLKILGRTPAVAALDRQRELASERPLGHGALVAEGRLPDWIPWHGFGLSESETLRLQPNNNHPLMLAGLPQRMRKTVIYESCRADRADWERQRKPL